MLVEGVEPATSAAAIVEVFKEVTLARLLKSTIATLEE